MPLFALGLNHHTAPLAIRERLAFPPERLAEALGSLRDGLVLREAALVSTCNRTELYCSTDSPEAAAHWLAQQRRVPLAEIAPYLYTLPEQEAVRHVFRVASGLDSMVLGEPQILGQMKEAARQADAAGTLGPVLHKLFQHSFAVAKDVRANTAIGANVVSMAAAAVRLSARIFEDMRDTRVLFIGAGEMIELCASHFAGASPCQMSVANRTRARAERVAARFGADVLALDAISEALPRYDIVIACTASPHPLIERSMVERALKVRRRRPMVLVDLAVPRDIDARVDSLSDVFLYTVDDLAQIVSAGLESRQSAVAEADVIIAGQVEHFQHWLGSRDAVPTIRQLREHAEGLRLSELERARRMLARGDDPLAVLESFSQSLSNKLLHGPIQFLNQAEGPAIAQTVATVQRVFQLDGQGTRPADS